MAIVKIPPSFKAPLVIQQLDISTWKEVWQCIGLSSEEGQDFTHERVMEYIIGSELIDEALYDFLSKIHNLGGPAGRNLICQAADDLGMDVGATDDEPDLELVARLWIASRQKKEFLQVLARAIAAFEFCKSSGNYKEFAGDSGVDIELFGKEQFKNLVCDWCTQNNKTGIVDLFVYSFDDMWCCDIVRGDPIKKVSVIRDDHQDILSYRPAIQDHIAVEAESGRIRVLSNSPKLIQVYRETMGQVLKASSNFFSAENICSLDLLQKSGAKIFEVDYFPEIHRVTVAKLNWVRGGDSLMVKGRDCLKLLNELSTRLEVTGRLIESKLRFDIAQESRPVFVTIKVPSKISVSKEEYEPLIFRYLDSVGLRGRFDIEQPKTFWELEPWHYSEAGWRKEIQGSFDLLKSHGCLKQLPLDYVPHPENDTASGTMAVELDEYGSKIAVSDELGMRSLTSTDVEGYKLDITALMSRIGHDMGLESPIREISHGLWYLGELKLAEFEIVQLFFSSAYVDVDLDHIISKNSSGSKPVLILPMGCYYPSSSVATVTIDVFKLCFDDLLARIVDTLNLSRTADPAIWCRADLVIDREKGMIWYEKKELTKLSQDSHAFKFAVMVAEGNGDYVLDEDIHRHLTCSDEDPVRKAKCAFIKIVKEELGMSGSASSKVLSDKLFKRRKPAWALNCSIKFIA